jgi:hypothetical protein
VRKASTTTYTYACEQRTIHNGETFEGVTQYESGVAINFVIPLQAVSVPTLYKALRKDARAAFDTTLVSAAVSLRRPSSPIHGGTKINFTADHRVDGDSLAAQEARGETATTKVDDAEAIVSAVLVAQDRGGLTPREAAVLEQIYDLAGKYEAMVTGEDPESVNEV